LVGREFPGPDVLLAVTRASVLRHYLIKADGQLPSRRRREIWQPRASGVAQPPTPPWVRNDMPCDGRAETPPTNRRLAEAASCRDLRCVLQAPVRDMPRFVAVSATCRCGGWFRTRPTTTNTPQNPGVARLRRCPQATVCHAFSVKRNSTRCQQQDVHDRDSLVDVLQAVSTSSRRRREIGQPRASLGRPHDRNAPT
jgi:hypothetical protein